MSDFTYRVRINADPWEEVDSFLEGRLKVVNHALRVTQRCLDDADYDAVRHYLGEISRALGWGPVTTAPTIWRWRIITADGLRDLAQLEQASPLVRPATTVEMAQRPLLGGHVEGCSRQHALYGTYCQVPVS